MLSRIADAVGAFDERDSLRAHASRYRNLYDAVTDFFRPRRIDGGWTEPFDPLVKEGNQPWAYGGGPGYTEGNAWHYLFFPHHDIHGMAALMGGEKRYVERLDEFFTTEAFYLTNQPLFVQPWLFTYIPGAEWKSHKKVSEVIATNFRLGRNGLPGNDDLGSTSSWAVWSMLGLYPILDGQALYRVGRPVFDSVVIHTHAPDGQPHDVHVVRVGDGDYVGSVKVDGDSNAIGSLAYAALHTASRIEIRCLADHPSEDSIGNASSMLSSYIPNNGFSLQPNPAIDVCIVIVADGLAWEISVIDALGRIIASTSTSTTSHLNTRNLAPGAYLVHGRSGNKHFVSTLCVQR